MKFSVLRLDDIIGFAYPGGEQQVRIPEDRIPELREADRVFLVARVRSSADLVKVALLLDAVEGVNDTIERVAVLPYLPYARADRRFVPGDCFGVKALGLLLDHFAEHVVTLDVHSGRCLREMATPLANVTADAFIHKAIVNFAMRTAVDHINVLFPDEGSVSRYGIPDVIGCNVSTIRTNVLYASKKRDPLTGKLSGFEVPYCADRPTLIVDDICDGGGTFLGIAEQAQGATLGLYVTHGIFSKGTDVLLDKFLCLFTTNSFREHVDTDRIEVFDCIPEIMSAAHEI